jgi:hypothetical protein
MDGDNSPKPEIGSEDHFVDWWKESYAIPPGKHARSTHTAYALQCVEEASASKIPKCQGGIFGDRTPEAAATQLAIALAQATEYCLATLERAEILKSTSKCELNRQRKICNMLVLQCVDLDVSPRRCGGREFPRLKRAHVAILKQQLSTNK